MKYIIITLFSFGLLNAGTLTFDNQKPQVSGEVSVSYHSANESGNFTLLVYHFQNNEKLPLAESFPLTNATKVKINSNDNFLLFKIMDAEGKIDDNNGVLWDMTVYSGEKPVKNSYFNRALSYLGATGENYSRVPSYEVIKQSLETELKNYPNNFRAKLALVTLKFDFKLIDFEEYDKEVRELLNTKIDISNALDISTAIKYLNSINESEKAENLENQFIENNPNSYLAKEKSLRDLSKVDSFNEFINKLTKYLNKYYNDNNISNLYNSFVYAHSQTKDNMEDLVDDIDNLTHKPAFLYNDIALTYLQNEDLRKEYTKEELNTKIDTNIKIGLTKIAELKDYRPRDVTTKEWDIYEAKVKSDLYLTKYKFEIEKNDSLDASKSVYEAISLAPHQMNAILYKEVLELSDKFSKTQELKQIIELAYKNNVVNRDLQNYILSLVKENKDLDIGYINSLIEQNKENNQKKITQSLVNGKKLTGFVQSLDKTFLDLEKLAGKVKIIAISSTWCDVCTQVYPTLNEIYTKYESNKNVSVYGISIWEDDDAIDAVNDMVKEYDIQFPYYIDNTDIIPRKYDIFGFPTILIVDGDNNVRYTIRGFANGEELSNLIDEFVKILE